MYVISDGVNKGINPYYPMFFSKSEKIISIDIENYSSKKPWSTSANAFATIASGCTLFGIFGNNLGLVSLAAIFLLLSLVKKYRKWVDINSCDIKIAYFDKYFLMDQLWVALNFIFIAECFRELTTIIAIRPVMMLSEIVIFSYLLIITWNSAAQKK